ncbi:MAG: DNA double-strand break repair nuclease NurA [Anaerolineae bacterium]|nr:DNA double-strand break repair nuclease NurA [Anaerolineae bacterium]
MAIDFQQIYERIKEIGKSAQERKEVLDERRQRALNLLNEYADDLDGLRKKVDTALVQDANIRCALPLNENLDMRVPTPALPVDATLIAADGSQIIPDRHAAIQFGLVNVGAIAMQLNSGSTPEVFTDSQLFFGDELLTEYGTTLSEGTIALRRDLAERTKLGEIAKNYSAPIITFTDGPIELWGNKDPNNAKSYQESMQQYLGALSRLQEKGITTAGYVDKPGSNFVTRLLEIAIATPEQLEDLRKFHPLLGVTDTWLYGEKGSNPILKTGERSAVFALQAKSKDIYKGILSLHFFYLNVGTDKHPVIVRVDIPKWVVDDPQKLNDLHAALIQQCRILGSKPYPYLLHRSHEVAVVSFDEKRQVEQMLDLELRRNNAEIGEQSGKQSTKDVAGKK